MIYLKVLVVYVILFAICGAAVLSTGGKNTAIALFVPSVIAISLFGKFQLSQPNANVLKYAVIAAFLFSILTIILAVAVQYFTPWMQSPKAICLLAFVGNFLFPFLLYPKLAESLKL